MIIIIFYTTLDNLYIIILLGSIYLRVGSIIIIKVLIIKDYITRTRSPTIKVLIIEGCIILIYTTTIRVVKPFITIFYKLILLAAL